MNTNLTPNRTLSIHIGIWLCFFILPLFLFHIALARELSGHPRLQFEVIALLLYRIVAVIGIFYLNYFILMPRFFFIQRYVHYALSILVLLVGLSLIPLLFLHPPPHLFQGPPPHLGLDSRPPFPRPFLPPYFSSPFVNTFMFISAFLVSFAIQLNRRYQEAMQTKLASELSWLKAQINPHFLFNALNSIYLLSLKKSDKTADSIIQLSEMMRYIISEANENRVALDKEIAYLNNYIAIQKLRLAPTVNLQYVVNGDAIGKQIAPLLLISFIENAFKYGISTIENSPITIIIDIEPKQLHLTVKNRNFGHHEALSIGTGIGVENTQKRLLLFYPNKHHLTINETDTDYTVSLSLQL